MAELLKPLGLAALIALGTPAFAQDTTEAPAEETPAAETPAPEAAPVVEGEGNPLGLEMGEQLDENGNPVVQQPESYIDEVFGDWSRECIRIPGNEGPDPCEMVQFMRPAPDAEPLGKISIARLPDNLKTVAGVTVIMPLGVVLTQQLTIGVDSAAPRRYPFQYCIPIGCFAQFGISAGELAAFKNGAKSTFTVVSMTDPSSKAPFDVSLSGFTAAFDSLPVLEIPAPQ
ncbi:MAG: invasion associated locus B family protein [Maritimibacter sp.]